MILEGYDIVASGRYIIAIDKVVVHSHTIPIATVTCEIGGHSAQLKMAKLLAAADDLLVATEALIAYRKRAGALNFQLEKADGYLHDLAIAVAKAKGE